MGAEDSAGKTDNRTNKTHPTEVDPLEFIATVDTTETRRKDAVVLLEMMAEITGQPPRMWGPSIIGFGEYHYKYASGREGDAPAVGFSPTEGESGDLRAQVPARGRDLCWKGWGSSGPAWRASTSTSSTTLTWTCSASSSP